MRDGSSATTKYVILWFRVFYGAHLTYSALRYYIAYTPVSFQNAIGFKGLGAITHPIAGPFVDALTATGIYHVVKTVELIVGALLLLNLFVPLALVVEMPISIVIFILNFFVVASERQLFSGPQEIILNILLMLFYARYYAPLLYAAAPPRPVWTMQQGDIRAP
jgi:riboflavin transporter